VIFLIHRIGVSICGLCELMRQMVSHVREIGAQPKRQCVSHGTGSWESRNTSEEMELPVKQAIAGQRVANQTSLTEMLHTLKQVVSLRS